MISTPCAGPRRVLARGGRRARAERPKDWRRKETAMWIIGALALVATICVGRHRLIVDDKRRREPG